MKKQSCVFLFIALLMVPFQVQGNTQLVRHLIKLTYAVAGGSVVAYAVHEYQADTDSGAMVGEGSVTFVTADTGIKESDFQQIDQVKTIDVSKLNISPGVTNINDAQFTNESVKLIKAAYLKGNPMSNSNIGVKVVQPKSIEAKAVLERVLPKDLLYKAVVVEPQPWWMEVWDFAKQNYFLSAMILIFIFGLLRRLF